MANIWYSASIDPYLNLGCGVPEQYQIDLSTYMHLVTTKSIREVDHLLSFPTAYCTSIYSLGKIETFPTSIFIRIFS